MNKREDGESVVPALLRWTGHPLVDVGIATLCCMTGKEYPGELRAEDLDQAAREMKEYYFSGLMTSYLSCVFMNSAYVQPNMGQTETADYQQRVLFAHRWAGDDEAKGLRCAFSGEPATHLIHRGQMPMLTGQEVLNFFPHGSGGLPVCGPCLVALQALPLGCRRSEGRLLAAYCDDPSILLALVKKYVEDNRRLMGLAARGKLPATEGPAEVLLREQAAFDKQKKRPKYPDAKAGTSLIAFDLMDISQRRRASFGDGRYASISIYWLSSSGQGPSLEIFHIPSQAVRFLVLASSAVTRSSWTKLVAGSWRRPHEKEAEQPQASGKKAKPRRSESPVAGGPGRSRNDVLADLFPIFESGSLDRRMAQRFLRRHMLGIGWHEARAVLTGGRQDTPKMGIDRPEWVDWSLTKLFLKEMLGMEDKRVEAVREFADKMADYIHRTNDRDVFRGLVYGRTSWEIRNALTKAQRNRAREHNELLFGLDDYVRVFVADDAVGKADWSLIRDLISIRLVEQLYKKDFFKEKNLDLLEEPETQTASVS